MQTEDKQKKSIKNDEAGRNTEAKENCTTVKAYTVLRIYEHCT